MDRQSRRQHESNVGLPSLHRAFCFRLMPHISRGTFPDFNYPTISVLSISSQLDNYSVDLTSEVSSECEELESEKNALVEESVLHSWHRPSCRPRSLSEPVSCKAEPSSRTCSLPDIEEKNRFIRQYETMYRVQASPSRLQFPEQTLEKLKEETTMSSQGQATQLTVIPSPLIMEIGDEYEENCGNLKQVFPTQEVPRCDEEVTGHWINRQPTLEVHSYQDLEVRTVKEIVSSADQPSLLNTLIWTGSIDTFFKKESKGKMNNKQYGRIQPIEIE